MKYKMIVSDFDGTLLRSDNTVGDKTRAAIAKYVAAGGVFTLSTGRNHTSIRRRLPETGLDKLNIPIMSLQGSLAVENLTGRELFAEFLQNETLMKFVALCERDNVYYHVYTRYDIYTERDCAIAEKYEKLTTIHVQPVGDLKAFARGRSDFVKVLAVCDSEKACFLAEKWGLEMGECAQVMTTSPHFVECISPRAGKGSGLKRVAKLLGIPLSDVIAVGDEMNDLSMIRAAGLGAAVSNARPALLESADYVTETNDDDGVLKLIERFCPEVL